jgi:DNA-3-methyladenine glycosylase II
MRARAIRPPATLETDADLRAGIRALRRKCAIARAVHDIAGDPPLRRRPAGLAGLARIVVGQQVSVASANAIWSRFEAAIAPLIPARVLEAGEAELRAVGLSRPKVRTLKAMARVLAEPGFDLEALSAMSDDDVRVALTKIPGIGPWTADVYLLFCLGRRDAFAPGDLALQVAAQHAMRLAERPRANELAEIAARWRPWRGVAAHLLWAYYRVVTVRSGGVPV